MSGRRYAGPAKQEGPAGSTARERRTRAKATGGVPRPDPAAVGRASATKQARAAKPETLEKRALQVLVDLVEAHRASGERVHPDNWAPLTDAIQNVVFLRFAIARDLADEADVRKAIDAGADDAYAVEFAFRELATFSNGEPVPYATLDAHWLGEVHALLVRHRFDDEGRVVRGDNSTSHFTPRELTDSITARTLEPILLAMQKDGPLTAERILSLKVCDPAVGGGAFLVSLIDHLAPMVVTAWREHGGAPEGVDLLTCAMQLVAMHCCVAVDKDAGAVTCCKRALWLHCRAKNMPMSWLDDNIKHGDALVGLSANQIASFTWTPEGATPKKGGPPAPLPENEIAAIRAKLDEAIELGARARGIRLERLRALALRGAA